LDKKEMIQDKKEYIKNNFIPGIKETAQDKPQNGQQVVATEVAKVNIVNHSQQHKPAQANIKGNHTPDKPNNQNQEIRFAHLKAQPQNQVKTDAGAEATQQTEKKAASSNISPNSVKIQNQQVNAQQNIQKPVSNLTQALQKQDQTENPEKSEVINPNNQVKQSNLNNINQVKVQNEVKIEHKISEQSNTIKQEANKNSQQPEIKVLAEAKPQKEQEESVKVDANRHQDQIPYIDRKSLQDKTKLGQNINENIKYADAKDKPVITRLELQNNSAESQLNQKHNQHQSGESISKIHNHQSHNNLPEINNQRAMQFDRIFDSKDTKQTLNSSVMDQVVKKASAELSTNKSQVTISLRPDNLGKVDINLISRNGVLTAQITAENNQVRDILNKGLETLRQSMTDQGVNVNRLVVNVQEPHTSNNNQGNLQQDQNFQKFDQTSQGSMNSNPNSHSSKQTVHQERANNYANNPEMEEEINPNLVKNNNSEPVMQGRVDYRV
ncbi:MAG: hypothetical protein ACD_20C00179G0001, partial [uncultured bacterium]